MTPDIHPWISSEFVGSISSLKYVDEQIEPDVTYTLQWEISKKKKIIEEF